MHVLVVILDSSDLQLHRIKAIECTRGMACYIWWESIMMICYIWTLYSVLPLSHTSSITLIRKPINTIYSSGGQRRWWWWWWDRILWPKPTWNRVANPLLGCWCRWRPHLGCIRWRRRNEEWRKVGHGDSTSITSWFNLYAYPCKLGLLIGIVTASESQVML